MKSKQNIYEKMSDDNWKRKMRFRYFVKPYFIRPYIFFAAFFIASYVGYVLVNYDNSPFHGIYTVISLLALPIFFYYFIKVIYHRYNTIPEEHLQKLISINDSIYKESQRVFSLKKYSADEIIEKSIQIQDHILDLSRIYKYYFWLDSKKKNLLKNHIQGASDSILNILKALQEKLGESMEREKNVLQKQQLEVKENITGNNYLNQVSELQSNRLKRQIEQFEKLQRILH